MNMFFRVLLAVYAFILTIVSLAAMVVTVKVELFERAASYLANNVLTNRGSSIAVFIVEFILFILSMAFLLSGFRTSKDKKCVSKHTNIGEIRISLNSIESIALAAAKRLNGVRETKAYVKKLGDAVSIAIKVIVLSDVNIPALSEDIQARVKKAVEESSGIGVNDINVIVDNIYTGYKPRVE